VINKLFSKQGVSFIDVFQLGSDFTAWNQNKNGWRISLFDDAEWAKSLRLVPGTSVEVALCYAIGRRALDGDASIHTIFKNCPLNQEVTIYEFATWTNVDAKWSLVGTDPSGTKHVFQDDCPLCYNHSGKSIEAMTFVICPFDKIQEAVVVAAAPAPPPVEEEEEEPEPMEIDDFFHPHNLKAADFTLPDRSRDTLRIIGNTVIMMLLNRSLEDEDEHDLNEFAHKCRFLQHGAHLLVRFEAVNETMAYTHGLILWSAQHGKKGYPVDRIPDTYNALLYIFDQTDYESERVNAAITYLNNMLKRVAEKQPLQNMTLTIRLLQKLTGFTRMVPTVVSTHKRLKL